MDDKYFALMGLVANILNGSCRLVWGTLYDYKGFKVSKSYSLSILGTRS